MESDVRHNSQDDRKTRDINEVHEESTDNRLYTPREFDQENVWDTKAYLDHFYRDKVDDPAMQLVIFYLPYLLAPLPKLKTALDFGAGPTCHVAMMLRNKVDEIYLADYLPHNREELRKWLNEDPSIDWGMVSRLIASQEAMDYHRAGEELQTDARRKVKDIYHCDMHKTNALPEVPAGSIKFDVVTTFFCVEYSCLEAKEYMAAVQNIFELVAPGGYLIMGGVMEVDWCGFGGRKYACLRLTENILFDSLKAIGVTNQKLDHTDSFKYYESEGMFLVLIRKKGGENAGGGDNGDRNERIR